MPSSSRMVLWDLTGRRGADPYGQSIKINRRGHSQMTDFLYPFCFAKRISYYLLFHNKTDGLTVRFVCYFIGVGLFVLPKI